MSSSTKSPTTRNSSHYESARSARKSRDKHRNKVNKLLAEQRSQNSKLEALQIQLQVTETKLQETPRRIECLCEQVIQLKEQPIVLPADLPPTNGTYGCKIIAMCLNLARQVGFRPAHHVLKTITETLNIEMKVPSWETIRGWACRAGVARLSLTLESADDWIWMVDHSNQIGQEKVLQVLAIRASELPPMGETLSREKMTVIANVLSTDWKRGDMRKVYRELMEKHGAPRFLLTDGAVELHETADALEKDGKTPVVLRDFKHYAANVFEKLIGKSEDFTKFSSEVGTTRSRIQQTELGHFSPAAKKPKARFMNLGPLLKWSGMVLSHFDNPESKSRENITEQRFAEKLGWIAQYRNQIGAWNRCQQVLQTGLRYVNENGLSQDSAAALSKEFENLFATWGKACELSSQFASRLIEFMKQSGLQLAEGERTWLSTENLESSFGAFKHLEGQHSKGGFTSLVAAMPMLLIHWRGDLVRECFERTSTKATDDWITENIGSTLTAKRNLAYKEAGSYLG